MNETDPPSIGNPLDDSDARHRHLGDWIIQGFANLKRKCESAREFTQENAVPVDQVSSQSKEVLYDQLHSYLLPLLKQQLATLSLLLDGLRQEPESNLRRLVEIQPDIDHNLAQIKSAMVVVCPTALSSSLRADDQQLKEFKAHRLLEFKTKLHFALSDICLVLTFASEHVELMGLSTTSSTVRTVAYHYRNLIKQARLRIEFAIKPLKGSEVDIAEDYWRRAALGIRKELYVTFSMANSTAHLKNYPFGDVRQLTHEPLIQLTKLTIPIIKLSKLFLRKLSKAGMNRKLISSFTEMNSIQLERLCKFAGKVDTSLRGILRVLDEIDLTYRPPATPARSRKIIPAAETLASHFDIPLQLVALYLIRLVPENGNQNYYRDWFITWNTQFTLAIHHFIQFAKTI
ncbi:hypothetical protein MJO28_001221 [Puccinia striiformis f. sp. tritici]|uniref:Uncharacterized protein n=3 Tax=Puccinia striiformis TaxID=27350 RepID=A0A0L0UZG9_9BASI|nr:hypothetical protein Pst134EA_000020 [Puccinia striiformis f. sp. tritici]KAI9601720.1 hypothetical protein H4Q26_001553 [Puccinia striiformis f. sp. tritici PST-130]KNE92438.1 hypothetical protein PSTG_14159 [Puccinia striiformis f. sp. tritici PST-78]POV99192.1 hypothetical protein PSTT_13928 [Puccinia striiformis]KAH9466145.1 hypothetical protein Pst134EB_001209 [Puccinia striiformis f. sp. tritici]KAH9472936.1 hypothetical protein Pst134EA_000020 [Puccinia striiformis f. sp. tritici]